MAAVGRVARSVPERRTSGCCSSSGLAESVIGPATSRDPASSLHPHPVFGQPVLYIPAPPAPPLVPCQWPMPLSYGPFPGMNYDMVVPPPPFPPPLYVRAPAYILPHPHVPPVDYRRLLHPHVYGHGASNQSQMSRSHLHQSAKATVNSEVQTEPTQRGGGGHDVHWPPASSDSGQGTVSISPCSSGSSSPKRQPAEAPIYELISCDARDCRVNEPADGSCSGTEKEIQVNDAGQNLLDVSIWSVESVAPYFPSTEWLILNGLAEPEDHLGEGVKNEIRTQTQEHTETRGGIKELSFCSEMLEDCTSPQVQNEKQSLPEEKELEVERDIFLIEEREPEEDQTVANSEEYTLSFPASMLSQDASTSTRDGEGDGPEPGTAEGPIQESPVKAQEKSPGVSQEELILLHSPAEEILQMEENAEMSDSPNPSKLSPSKGRLVDFGVQCSELQVNKCVCEESRLQLKNAGLKNEAETKSRCGGIKNRPHRRNRCRR